VSWCYWTQIQHWERGDEGYEVSVRFMNHSQVFRLLTLPPIAHALFKPGQSYSMLYPVPSLISQILSDPPNMTCNKSTWSSGKDVRIIAVVSVV
jgi:hypothetical protein